MPKRAEAYMASQRDHIAATVFRLIRDNGLHETSLRKICEQAGVSMGAFYVHFPGKWAAIDAALEWNAARTEMPPLPATWDEFESRAIAFGDLWNDIEQRKLFRLSFELSAEAAFSQEKWSAPGLALDVSLDYLEQALAHLQAAGEIEAVQEPRVLARQIIAAISGANYVAALVPECREPPYVEEMKDFIRRISGRNRRSAERSP